MVFFLKRIILVFYWLLRNTFGDVLVQNYSLSPKLKLGKKIRIRKGSEVYQIELGDYSYISGPNSYIEDAIIGKYCSIARGTVIGVSDHNYKWVTTSPIITCSSYGIIKGKTENYQKKAPRIGNDVWIGLNSIIMRGVVIGDGSIIAAGAVVTKDVEPYSIVGGVPARTLNYRYDNKTIEALLRIKWWDWSVSKITENRDCFYDIDNFIKVHDTWL